MRKAFKSQLKIKCIIIRCKFFSPFIGREPTTWPTNNRLQIMVYSYAISSNCVWLQIIFCSCDHSFVKMTACWRYLSKKKNLATEWWNNYWTQLSQNISRVLSVESRSIIYLGFNIRLWQIIDLLATVKTRYFAQPCAITVNWLKQGRVIKILESRFIMESRILF